MKKLELKPKSKDIPSALGISEKRCKELLSKAREINENNKSHIDSFSQIVEFVANQKELIFTMYAYGRKSEEKSSHIDEILELAKSVMSPRRAAFRGAMDAIAFLFCLLGIVALTISIVLNFFTWWTLLRVALIAINVWMASDIIKRNQ